MTSPAPNSEDAVAVCKRVFELERELFSTTDESRVAEIIAELRRLAPEDYAID